MADSREVDEHVIHIDLNPGTERNIRTDERNLVLDQVEEAVLDVTDEPMSLYVHRGRLRNRLALLRPSTRRPS